MSVRTVRSHADTTNFAGDEKPVTSGVTVGDGDFVTLASGAVTNPGTGAIYGKVNGGPSDNLVSRTYRAPVSTGLSDLSRTVLIEFVNDTEFDIDVNGQLAVDAEGKYFNLANGGAAASVLLTSDATTVSNNDTITIGGVVYTFKTTLTGAANEILIGANAAANLTNLQSALNLGGTIGTDYGTGTVINPLVAGGTKTATTLLLTARDLTVSGRAIAVSKSATHLSFDNATLYGGPTDQVIDNLSKKTTIAQFFCRKRIANSAGLYTKGRFVAAQPQTLSYQS
jgi:hypothetical protein